MAKDAFDCLKDAYDDIDKLKAEKAQLLDYLLDRNVTIGQLEDQVAGLRLKLDALENGFRIYPAPCSTTIAKE